VSTGIHRYNTDHISSKYFVFSESVYLQNNAVPLLREGCKIWHRNYIYCTRNCILE